MDTKELSDDAIARIYNAIWQNISREDSNVSSRLSWAISLTSGQFTAISFLVGGFAKGGNEQTWPILIAVTITAISLLGMYFCFRTNIGVIAAHEQIKSLREHYLVFEARFKELHLPRPFGESGQQPGRRSSAAFPVVLLSFWSLIFVAGLGASIWTIATAASSIRNEKAVQ